MLSTATRRREIFHEETVQATDLPNRKILQKE